MRATSKFLALALAAVLQPAIAAPAPIVLDFEDITTQVDPDGVVNLQTPRYAGVEFKGAAWGVTASACDSDAVANFIPRDGGCGALLFASARSGSKPGTQSATINLAQGFITGSSLYYSAWTTSAITVTLYEGLDATSPIASYDQGLTKADCSRATFCDWNLLSFNFDGVAKSIVISGLDRSLMLDDLSFLPFDATDPTRLPEPGALALALSALGALGWARKRAAR